jgi:hypothetical protein
MGANTGKVLYARAVYEADSTWPMTLHSQRRGQTREVVTTQQIKTLRLFRKFFFVYALREREREREGERRA